MNLGSIYKRRNEWIGGHIMWRVGESVSWAVIFSIDKLKNTDFIIIIRTENTITRCKETGKQSTAYGRGAYMASLSMPLKKIDGALAFNTAYVGPTILIPKGREPEEFISLILEMETLMPRQYVPPPRLL